MSRNSLWFLLASLVGRMLLAEEPSVTVARLENLTVSSAGVGIYCPETWGAIRVRLKNPLDREMQLLVATHFGENPSLQYGRRIWIPPRSSLSSWHPLKMPKIDVQKQQHFELRTQVIETTNGVETLLSNEYGSQQFEQALIVAATEPVTVMIDDMRPAASVNSPGATPLDVVLAARNERGMRRNFVSLTDAKAPAGEELLDIVDHLVVTSDRIRHDAAAIGAIRRWVTAGGRLWIMADRVSLELLHLLLGDEGTVTEVDRVGLTRVHMVGASEVIGAGSFDRELERPADFVRMVVQDFRVESVVDGWPAAFWKPYGRGLIYVTTVGCDGWVHPLNRSDPSFSGGSSPQSNFKPGELLSELALRFFTPRPAPPVSRNVAENYVQQLVGYSIPSRNHVIGTLLAFTIAMTIIGWRLATRGRLELLVVVIPVLATAAAAMQIYLGWTSRSGLIANTSVLEVIQAVPGTDDIQMTGKAAVLSSDSHNAVLSGQRGGWMLPQIAEFDGMTRRLVWTDIDQWAWEKLPSPPGLQMVSFQTSGTADIPLACFASFGPDGIRGLVTFPSGLKPQDAIIATSLGRMGVVIQSDGRLVGSGAVFGSTQYLATPVLNDEQQRRTAILADLLKPDSNHSRLSVPTLFFWTTPWRVGMSLTRDLRVTGSALVSVPVHWKRPDSANLLMKVPSALLPFREVQGPDGLVPTGMYDWRRGQWAEKSRATACWLGFDVPKAILPVEIQSATVTFKVLGPMRRLELSASEDGKTRSIKVWDNPVGTLTHQITDASLLKLDTHGRLLLRVDAGLKDERFSDGTIPSTDNGPTTGNGSTANNGSSTKFRTGVLDPSSHWQFEDVTVQITARIPASEDHSEHAGEFAR